MLCTTFSDLLPKRRMLFTLHGHFVQYGVSHSFKPMNDFTICIRIDATVADVMPISIWCYDLYSR